MVVLVKLPNDDPDVEVFSAASPENEDLEGERDRVAVDFVEEAKREDGFGISEAPASHDEPPDAVLKGDVVEMFEKPLDAGIL